MLRGEVGIMAWYKTKGAMVGLGFLLGTVGVKAATSEPAKKLYVEGVAAGMRAKAGYDDIVEQAKAQVDDIVAEAEYLNKDEKKPAKK